MNRIAHLTAFLLAGLVVAGCGGGDTSEAPDGGPGGTGGTSGGALPHGDGTGTVTFQVANGAGGNALHPSFSGTGNVAFLTAPLIASTKSGNCFWDLSIEPPVRTGSYTLVPFYDFTLALAGNTADTKAAMFYREQTDCSSTSLPGYGWTSTGGTVSVTVTGNTATATFDGVPVASSGNGDAVHGYLGTGPSKAAGSATLNSGSLTLTIH